MSTSDSPPTLKALRARASQLRIPGAGQLKTRAELVAAIRAAELAPSGRVDRGFFELPRPHERPAAAGSPAPAAPFAERDEVLLWVNDAQSVFAAWTLASEPRPPPSGAAAAATPAVFLESEGGQRRLVPVALDWQRTHVGGLEPGQRWRASLVFAREGQVLARISADSAWVALPPRPGPSARTIEQLRVPWSLPRTQLGAALADGRASKRVVACPVAAPPRARVDGGTSGPSALRSGPV